MDLTAPSSGREPRRSSSEPPRRQRRARRPPPPPWLVAVLSLCLAFIIIATATKSFRPGEKPAGLAAAAEGRAERVASVSLAPMAPSLKAVAVPTPGPTAPPVPAASAAITAGPMPSPETMAAPLVEEEKAPREPVTLTESGSWFSDAVFIGDSRVVGLRLYSGITPEAAFLDHTGLTVYEVKEEKRVIRKGDQKVSVLEALSGGSYGKVYIALGVNELGYFNPVGFAEACGEVVEAVRERQPEARIYIQSLLPVNTAKCKANDIPYYITNEGIAGYNEALETYFAGKDVYLLGIPDGLTDETGQVFKEYSADGVHFKKDGYVLWLNYLAAHTEGRVEEKTELPPNAE